MSIHHAAVGDSITFPRENARGTVISVGTTTEYFSHPSTGDYKGELEAPAVITVKMDTEDDPPRSLDVRKNGKYTELTDEWESATSDPRTVASWNRRRLQWEAKERPLQEAICA